MSLIRRKSWVLVKPQIQDTCESSGHENDLRSNGFYEKARQQSSNELLQAIFSDLENADRSQPLKKVKLDPDRMSVSITAGCNCKKTKCLKLYCECFSSGGYCRPGCSCLDCCNNLQTEEIRAETIAEIVVRDPRAFSFRHQKENTEMQFKGCNCKKSGCQKKYCDCYNLGMECGEYCKCEGCKNCKESHGLQPIEMKKYVSSII